MVNRVRGCKKVAIWVGSSLKVIISVVGWRIVANLRGSTRKVVNWVGSTQKVVNRVWGAEFVLIRDMTLISIGYAGIQVQYD